MNLAQIRHLFRTMSGRYDLADADSGQLAIHFINEGSKYLDRLNENQKSWASTYRFIEAGGFSAFFPYCRAIKEVWVATDDERWQLEKKGLHELTDEYLADLPDARDTGETLYYAPMITRYVPEDATLDTFEAFAGFVDVLAGDAHEYNGILVAPPPEERIMVDIRGLFYSIELVDETDENYWSAVHPTLLVLAAMRQIEVFNKNKSEVTSMERQIKEELTLLGFDLVEELIAEADEMVG